MTATTTTAIPGTAPAPEHAQRPLLVGPSTGPTPPYPLRMEGIVIKGFGRGSKELGIPTANLPVDDAASSWIADIPSGVYFGWASLRLPPTHPNYSPVNHNGFALHPMVMSIGYNPFYKNTVRSAEVHVLHGFGADFYGAEMRLLIVGFIRQERDYAGLDALIRDINFDCEVARRSLARPAWRPKHGLPAGEEAGELECDWLLRPSGADADASGGEKGVDGEA